MSEHLASAFVCGADGTSPQTLDYQINYMSIYSYSLLPALSLEGILSLDIIEGSFNTARFAQFIDELLYVMNPYPGPNSVIVMDNCSIHKDQMIIEMIEERYLYSYPVLYIQFNGLQWNAGSVFAPILA